MLITQINELILTLLYPRIKDLDQVHPSITLSPPTILFPSTSQEASLTRVLPPGPRCHIWEKSSLGHFPLEGPPYCAWHDGLQFQSFSGKWKNCILLCSWIKLQCAYILSLLMHSFIMIFEEDFYKTVLTHLKKIQRGMSQLIFKIIYYIKS